MRVRFPNMPYFYSKQLIFKTMIGQYDDNLPPQLATDSNFNNEKEVDCEYCEGTGKAQESCCGDRLNDYGI